MTTTEEIVTGGIDTHADTHHVAIINQYGKQLADKEFLAAASGYRKIIAFLQQYGALNAVGVEGAGCHGAELTRELRRAGITVIKVNRPNRKTADNTANRIPLTLIRPPRLSWPRGQRQSRSTGTTTWNPSAPSVSSGPRP